MLVCISVPASKASVAPDLRRVVLYWEPQRLNSENQTISKRKVAGIERRLQTQERWIRAQVTRHLNLKVRRLSLITCTPSSESV